MSEDQRVQTVSVVGHAFILGRADRCAMCNYPADFPAHWSGTYTGPWPIPTVK